MADTPAWLGFISSRKRDSQITVYPHRGGSQFGLDPCSCKMKKPHTDTLTLYAHMRAHAHAQRLHRGATANHNWCLSPFLLHMYAVCVLVRHHMPRPSPCFLSNTPTCTIKACGLTASCRCVCERARERIGETDDTRALFNLQPLFE